MSAEENNETGSLKGQGAFSLKSTGRKKRTNPRVIMLVGGGVLFVILFAIFFASYMISVTPKSTSVVDESKAKEAPILKPKKQKDDSMRIAMEKKTSEGANVKSPPTSTVEETSQESKQNEEQAQTTSDYQQPESPFERPEESLFSVVSRFDSAHSSATAYHQGDRSESSNSSIDDDEARLRAFAQTDTEAEVRKLTGGSGVNMRTEVGSLLDNLSGTEYVKVKARLAPAPKYLLKRMTNFQCVLYTAIKTDYPGLVSCRLIRPLYSADGSVILAEAGAELTGEQRVEIKAGQTSVFTVWTELDTSPGVRASLNALGTDAMGRSGTDAYIDNHYGQRFGGAVMLSFVKDALSSAANFTKKSGNGYNVSNSEHNAEDMASRALENSINIPPTGYVLPGTVLNVIVAHDIDFSSVYTTR